MSEKNGVLILGEVFAGILSPHTHEMFTAGTQLAEKLGEPLTLAMMGSMFEEVEPYMETLDDSINVTWHEVEEEEPFPYMAWKDIATGIVESHPWRVVIAPGTGIGVDWTPRVAAKLGLPLASWATGVDVVDGRVSVSRDVLGGRAETAVSADADATFMIALEPGMIEPTDIGTAEIVVQVVVEFKQFLDLQLMLRV